MKEKPGKIPLFSEFPPLSANDWEAKILTDLKGSDYEKKFIRETTGGLNIKPYYRAEDIEKAAYPDVPPGDFPFLRGNSTTINREIRQDIDEPNPGKANSIALNAVSRGANAVGFNVSEVGDASDIKALLNEIDLRNVSVHFISASSFPVLLNLFYREILRQKIKPSIVKGSFNFDPLNYFLMTGSFRHSLDEEINEAAEFVKKVTETLPRFRSLTVNGQYFHNSGASVVQELAFTIAAGCEYLTQLTGRGISIDKASPQIRFVYAAGSGYFMEIAKLRAARMLWAKIVEQYNPVNACSAKSDIHVVTSLWNKSVYDPCVNMLRNTTGAMAAVIGGCNSLSVTPFDSAFKKPDEFSERNARNIQLILKEEACLDKTTDPSAGSYYIETLTFSIAEAALKLFLDVDEKGGFIKAVEAGFICDEIEITSRKRDNDIALRRQVFVGVSQYPDLKENMIDKISPHTLPSQLGKLKQYRGTQTFEALRLSTEAYKKNGHKAPAVFLFTYGNPAMRKKRALFTTNFFGCAGYSIIDNPGFKTIDEGIKDALKSNAEIIVFCSSDDEYAELAASACNKLLSANPDLRIIVAGYPADIIELLKKEGVNDFINVHTNVPEMLAKYQKIMGII